MFRLKGSSRVLRRAAPDAYAGVYEAVTTAGDTVTVLLLVALVYWLGSNRRNVAVTVGYSFAALSLVLALKAAFGLPRPPESLWLIDTEGFGFPSGHATAAAVVYGGLAHAHGWWRRAGLAVPVALLILAIGLSRVVLGVHYLGDILAGFALGATVVLVGTRVADREPIRAFALAVACAVAAVALAGLDGYAPLALGGTLGGALASARFDLVPADLDRREQVVTVAVGLLAAAPVVVVVAMEHPPVVAAVVVNAVAVAGVVLAPAAGRRLPRLAA
jgi:membrane-associated phospholipid phosphatase